MNAIKDTFWWPYLKPLIKSFFETVVIPDLQKLEDKIGNEAIKHVIDGILVSIEAEVEKILV